MSKNKLENLDQELQILQSKKEILKIQLENQKEKKERLEQSIEASSNKLDRILHRIQQIQEQQQLLKEKLIQDEEFVEVDQKGHNGPDQRLRSSENPTVRISEIPESFDSLE